MSSSAVLSIESYFLNVLLSVWYVAGKMDTPSTDFQKLIWKKLIDSQERLLEKEDIALGKHSLDGDGNDFVDAFLIKMEKDRREGRHPSQSYKEDELLYDVFDLWIAGHETTALTLMWGFMHLMKNPDVRNFYEKTD
ncbi:hypothetical protein COOONC_12417 [Cooperia oncophora]